MTKNPNHAQVLHFDLQGKREFKYDFLNQNSLSSIAWNELQPEAPNFFLVKKNFDQSGIYEKGFKVDELFTINTSGIKTHSDATLVGLTKFKNSNEYYNYRPFDIRNIEYDLKKVQRHRYSVMKHMLQDNLAIMTCRQLSTFDFQHILISKYLVDMCTVSLQTKETTYAFPLYLYPEANGKDLFATTERTPNLNAEIVQKIADGLGLAFVNEPVETRHALSLHERTTFAPIDLLDYIYAVLHSPTYREKYKEFLKIDFPRVPYPTNEKTFWQLVALGSEIRQIHLLESPIVEQYITQYPIDGDNVVTKPCAVSVVETLHATSEIDNKTLRVFINETQYFDNVPQIAWEFFIGGYQPAQKWLKDRKERTLEFDDILHYQKIIVALTQTDRLMREIENIDIEPN